MEGLSLILCVLVTLNVLKSLRTNMTAVYETVGLSSSGSSNEDEKDDDRQSVDDNDEFVNER